ncbi:MAG TPA: hypothetical protein VIW95_03525 [Candidatus Binatus sp.]|uniref:hypothetical protein n=1 Tax=Candidatus Binatus sp. TaxID=2811406 RepID=UPI002F40A069
MRNDAIESKSVAATDAPAAAIPLLPMLTCVAAGLALAYTPVLVWRIKTGTWVCMQQPETFYYLQIAAQAYYNHLWYISDPIVAEGVTFYPWLPFVPVVFVARIFGLSIFSVALIWSLIAGLGIGAGLYLLFWWFLRRPWVAAGLTIFCLSDSGFCAGLEGPFVIVSQMRRIVSALVVHPVGDLLSFPFILWRAPDPALDLPFLFLQIVAVSNARERPRSLNLWLSGLAFGLLFYLFFYLWTMAAAALFIAWLLDPAGRRVYRWTLSIGFAIGLPELAMSLYSRALVSAEAIARFGMFVHTSRTANVDYPIVSVAIAIVVGLWIWRTRRVELIYLLSLMIAGILLSDSRLIAGISFHEYHFEWLWWPVRLVLILIVIATVAEPWIPRRPKYVIALSTFVLLYLLGAIYLNAIEVTRTRFGNQQLDDFVRYRTQRMAPGVAPLIPRSIVAGSEHFCELAGVAENQRMLSGWIVPTSTTLDNSSWETRTALNAFLSGDTRADFVRDTAENVGDYWFLEPIQPKLREGFIREFDDVTRDPDKAIRVLEVRYVALPTDKSPTPYITSRFRLLQPGLYWQIWQIREF